MSMTKYRPQRGGLDESMREVVDVTDLSDLRNLIGASPSDVVDIKPYGYDTRIGWDTHLVTVNGCAVGYTNGEPTLPKPAR